ncbi:hypothetical protein [uncultured Enterococcus sp.]|uniref:hypothetical protein n=1 Tax=uncultured Enterococcus sp. TaxID=167972 RepID=UPI002AA76D76|nr:hypothetical protein [uncultured Enterococcus sp.]
MLLTTNKYLYALSIFINIIAFFLFFFGIPKLSLGLLFVMLLFYSSLYYTRRGLATLSIVLMIPLSACFLFWAAVFYIFRDAPNNGGGLLADIATLFLFFYGIVNPILSTVILRIKNKSLPKMNLL